jgi:TPR repeat protein
MAETAPRVPLSARIASAHGLNWNFDPRYRWAWYIWPQTVAVLAAAWLLAGMPDLVPQGEWSKPAETAGAQMDQLRDAAKTDLAARDRLKRLAEAGDPFAQFSYATLFDPIFNFTNTPDINAAMEWYLKAATQGHATSQSNYGWRTFYGQGGLAVEYDKAFPWLLKAAQQGVTDAQSTLGIAYRDGKGTKADLVTALKWFRAAADSGNAYSQAEIGDAYAEGKPGYDKNITEAIAWYRKAVAQKETYAERRLGLIYLNGQGGVAQDPAAAYDFLKQAAESGDQAAQYYLGTMYEKGIFVKEDRNTAMGWYKKSADQGYEDAQKALNALGAAVSERKENITTNKPSPSPSPSETDAASTCLNETNPNTAMSMCQVFLGNNAALSNETLTKVYNQLALASLRLKDYNSLLSWTKKSLDIVSNTVEHYLAGQAYAAQKDWKHAVDEFSEAVAMTPKYTLAFHRRGEAYMAMGDYVRAKSDFETALSITPKFVPSIQGLKAIKRRG